MRSNVDTGTVGWSVAVSTAVPPSHTVLPRPTKERFSVVSSQFCVDASDVGVWLRVDASRW